MSIRQLPPGDYTLAISKGFLERHQLKFPSKDSSRLKLPSHPGYNF